jgi:hypothetical protein
MRLFSFSLVFLFGLSVIGCGGESGPTTVDSSAIESYVAENPEAVALQEELDAAAEAAAAAEEAEED